MPASLEATLAARGGIVGRLQRETAGHEGRTALVGNRRCRYPSLTYKELFGLVERLAAGFLAYGVQPGDRIGVVSENQDLWILCDLALLSIGAVDVPRGGDASAEEVRFVLEHAGCKGVIAEGAEQVHKLGDLADKLRPLVVLDEAAVSKDALGIEALLAAGDTLLLKDKDCVRTATERVSSQDLATIIYTSGTTGNPKGVMLRHGNILHNLCVVPQLLHLAPGMRFLSFLPTWHVFERTLEYVILDRAMELHYSTKWTLKQDFPRVAPDFVAAVPRVWEGFAAAIETGLEKKPPFVRRLVRTALAGSKRRTEALRMLNGQRLDREGRRLRPTALGRIGKQLEALLLSPVHGLADRLVYAKVRAATGGRLCAGISGGGPLPAHVDEFLTRAGLPLLNGYGLTETAPVLSVRVPERNVLGTIGKPLPHTEIRIVDERGQPLPVGQTGVIQARGPQIMAGYHANPTATSKALDAAGWFDTGDLGALGAEGDLMISGRAKDTIVLRGGENVEPEPLEATLVRSPYIADALLVGHGQKMLGALLVPSAEALRASLALDEPDDAALSRRPEVVAKLKAEVARLVSKQNGYRSFEMIGPLVILERPFSIEDGTLTATMKKKRHTIEKLHADLIHSLYEGR